jgi:hypothetical protein
MPDLISAINLFDLKHFRTPPIERATLEAMLAADESQRMEKPSQGGPEHK